MNDMASIRKIASLRRVPGLGAGAFLPESAATAAFDPAEGSDGVATPVAGDLGPFDLVFFSGKGKF